MSHRFANRILTIKVENPVTGRTALEVNSDGDIILGEQNFLDPAATHGYTFMGGGLGAPTSSPNYYPWQSAQYFDFATDIPWYFNGAWKQMLTTQSTQTMTNKTLTSPVISTIVNTGTLTLPTSTDTLVGRATTDTLTNKTLTTPTIGDYTNATHNHSNAAGGGTLSASVLASGTVDGLRLDAYRRSLGMNVNGYLAESFDVLYGSQNGNTPIATTAGLKLSKVWFDAGQTVSGFHMLTAATAAAGTVDMRGGLYVTGNTTAAPLAGSNAVTAAAVQSLITFTFTTPYVVPTSGYYYLGYKMASGTTSPTWVKSPALASTITNGQTNVNLSSGNYRFAQATSQSGAMPTLSGYAADTQGYWMGAF